MINFVPGSTMGGCMCIAFLYQVSPWVVTCVTRAVGRPFQHHGPPYYRSYVYLTYTYDDYWRDAAH